MDTFYEIRKETIKELFYDAKNKAFKCWCDEKDQRDWRRVLSLKSFDDVFKLLENDKNAHYVFIIRQATTPVYSEGKELLEYVEIGGCTISDDVEYFIFMYLETKHLEYFIDKYSLTTAQIANE